MYNKSKRELLRLFGEAAEGEATQVPVHTPQAEQAGEKESAPVAEGQSNTSREEAFRALMEGEYKDLFTAYFQETFNRRFKEHKGMKEELDRTRAVLAAVGEQYGTTDEAALLAAIRVEKDEKNAPTEAAKPQQMPTLDAQLEAARCEAREALLASIRARGMRPAEGALSLTPTERLGAAQMTRAERAELARRAAMGEQVTL